MRALVILPILLGLATPARAEKSEGVSFGLAATGTAVSSTLVLSAFLLHPEGDDYNPPLLVGGLVSSVITPSLGHLYAEQWLTIGMGIRGIAGALALWGLSMKQDVPCVVVPSQNCPETTGTGLTLVSLAAIAYIGGVAYDVRDAKDAARRHNRKHGGISASLVPTGTGAAVVGRF